MRLPLVAPLKPCHHVALVHSHFLSYALLLWWYRHQARCGPKWSVTAASFFGFLFGFGFGGLLIAIDEMLKGFSLRAFSATSFGLFSWQHCGLPG